MRTLLATILLSLATAPPVAADTWVPLAPPQRVLAVERDAGDFASLTEVVTHDGRFTALRPNPRGWELLTSAGGFDWDAAPIEGTFADPGSPVSLAAVDGTLLAFELTPGLVMWRSPDGRRWQRAMVDDPWPAASGLRIRINGVDARLVGGRVHVTASVSALADWEALLGVPDHLVVPRLGTGGTLDIRVTSGDREGRYEVRLAAERNAVLLRIIDGDDRVVGEQRLAPVADPDAFVELFVACGGFSPMQESWLIGPDGELVAPPAWLAELGDYPVLATAAEATFGLARDGRLVRLDAAGAWQPEASPTSLAHHLFTAGGRALLVGEQGTSGIAIWAFEAGDWRLLPAPPVDGAWLAGAAPDRRGALLVYDSDGPLTVAVVVGGDRARTYRLGIPEAIAGITVAGDTAVLRTVRSDGDTALWAWRIERPQRPGRTAI